MVPTLYRCLSCMTTMNGIIRQCLSGHNYCDQCFEQLMKCPVCKEGMASGRNRALEAIHPEITVRCANQVKNCQYGNNLHLIQAHENLCFYSNRVLCLEEVGDKWVPQPIPGNVETVEPIFQYLPSQSVTLIHPDFFNLSSEPKIFTTKELLYHKKWLFRPYCRIGEYEVKWCIAYYGPKTKPGRSHFNIKLVDNHYNVTQLISNEECVFTNGVPLPDMFIGDSRFNFLRQMCVAGNLYYFFEIFVYQ